MNDARKICVNNKKCTCPNCGRTINVEGADSAPRFCSHCGIRVSFYTLRSHHVHDQGGGGSWCGNCGHSFGGNPSTNYEKCPNCRIPLKEGDVTISRGGSDY